MEGVMRAMSDSPAQPDTKDAARLAIVKAAMTAYDQLAAKGVLNGNAAATVRQLVQAYCGSGIYHNNAAAVAALEKRCTLADLKVARDRFTVIAAGLKGARMLPGTRESWY